jgi:AraC-like DNA-binding protein
MQFSFNLFSSLLLIFFIHGLVYAMLLYRKSVLNETHSDKWLSLFLFLCILYICPWMTGFAGWYDTQPYRDILFYTPFQHLYFIGPVIYFYVQSLLNPSFRFGKKEWLQLVPGLLYLLYSLVMVTTDKLVLGDYYFLASGADPDFETWYQLSGFVSMLVYFILSLRYYQLYRKLMVQVISYADSVLFRWIRNFLLAFLIMLSFRLLFFVLGEIFDLAYKGFWWYFLFFGILFYYIAITGYANSIETKVPFRTRGTGYPQTLLLLPAILDQQEAITEEAEVISVEPVLKKQSDEQLSGWKEKILEHMQVQKAYEDPELSLSTVARELKTNPAVISRTINQGFELNFNDFVNQFRIDAVKEMLDRGEHKKQTLLGIAFDCGFNSKATFNRAFKKATGLSPKEWLEKNG